MYLQNNEAYPEQVVLLARFAKALGHPARIVIMKHLASLNECSCCFNTLFKMLPIAKSTISQHLKELKEAGLIIGRIEPPHIQYCVNKENLNLAKKLFSDLMNLE